MNSRVIALISGGLDSMLAVRVLQRQPVEIEGLYVQTPFVTTGESAAQVADELGVPLTVQEVDEDYVEVLRNPRYGFGKAANPCLDCHLYMAIMARRLMEERDACCVITGEILGQRPMSQKRHHLGVLERRSGLEGRLLRPLSAKWLEPTIPEQQGLIDRDLLCDFSGRRRSQLVEKARELGAQHIPAPSPGCALTQKTFAPRLRDLFQFNRRATLWDCELAAIGRHMRIDETHKVVLGRHAEDNARMAALAASAASDDVALLEPESFVGPNALLCGPFSDEMLQIAGNLMAAYTRQVAPDCQDVLVRVLHGGSQRVASVGLSRVAQVRSDYAPIA